MVNVVNFLRMNLQYSTKENAFFVCSKLCSFRDINADLVTSTQIEVKK